MTNENQDLTTSNSAATLRFSGDPTLDSVLYLVTDQRRRCLLYVLERVHPKGVDLDDLARTVVEVDEDATSVDRVRTDLVHHQLPRMAAAGVIEYDRESSHVRYIGSDLLEEMLRWMRTRELTDLGPRPVDGRRYR